MHDNGKRKEMTKYSLFTKQSREDEHLCATDTYLHVYIEFVGIQLRYINLCVCVYIYSMQLNVSNINTKKHYCTKNVPTEALL